MEGTDESTELWRHPTFSIILLYQKFSELLLQNLCSGIFQFHFDRRLNSFKKLFNSREQTLTSLDLSLQFSFFSRNKHVQIVINMGRLGSWHTIECIACNQCDQIKE